MLSSVGRSKPLHGLGECSEQRSTYSKPVTPFENLVAFRKAGEKKQETSAEVISSVPLTRDTRVVCPGRASPVQSMHFCHDSPATVQHGLVHTLHPLDLRLHAIPIGLHILGVHASGRVHKVEGVVDNPVGRHCCKLLDPRVRCPFVAVNSCPASQVLLHA